MKNLIFTMIFFVLIIISYYIYRQSYTHFFLHVALNAFHNNTGHGNATNNVTAGFVKNICHNGLTGNDTVCQGTLFNILLETGGRP